MDSVLVGLLLFTCITFAHPQQQHSVPSIFIYDDFERCEATASVYCYARTILRVDQFPTGFVVPQTEVSSALVKVFRMILWFEEDSGLVTYPVSYQYLEHGSNCPQASGAVPRAGYLFAGL